MTFMESNKTITDGLAIRAINYRVILVQVMICVFLFINFFLMMTFFLRDCFYTSMRYILFVVTLFSDCLFLLMTNALLIFVYFNFAIQIWLCVIIYIVLAEYSLVTPLTLTAMALERYVAICMPLRHAELCTTRATLHLIIIIHSISFVPGFVIVTIFFARVTHVIYKMGTVCSVETFILYEWMNHLRSVLYLLYFLIMCIVIVFSYVQIMKAAKAASGENKKSTWRGLRTVILHALQLLLCLIQMWCPFIEAAMLQIDFMLFINIRYFNYITFILAPRCLSPLIYGLRDELFFQAVRYYALCGLYKKQASV